MLGLGTLDAYQEKIMLKTYYACETGEAAEKVTYHDTLRGALQALRIRAKKQTSYGAVYKRYQEGENDWAENSNLYVINHMGEVQKNQAKD